MNQAYLHLVFNHAPIISTLVAGLVLAAGLVLRNVTVQRTALGILTFAAVAALPAYFTGEGAEHIIRRMGGIDTELIEQHEQLGNMFFFALVVAGVSAAFVLWRDVAGKLTRRIAYPALLVAMAGLLILALFVGSTGGKIRHTETSAQPTEALLRK